MLTALIALLAPALAAPEDSLLNSGDRDYELSLHGELGTLGVIAHTIQFGKDGSAIDYREDGGQDILFSFARLSADVEWGKHTATFLYQPLDIQTEVTLRRDLTIDGVDFAEGAPVEMGYGFPFYRASWVRDFAKADDLLVALGGSLQIRNATLTFATANGETRVTNRDVGPVPLAKIKLRKDYDSGHWIGSEIDGFYAPIAYLNGSNTDVIGAILDASVRGGITLDNGVESFLNVRYLGGGATGTSDPYQFGDGYVRNWLNFMSVSLGFSLR